MLPPPPSSSADVNSKQQQKQPAVRLQIHNAPKKFQESYHGALPGLTGLIKTNSEIVVVTDLFGSKLLYHKIVEPPPLPLSMITAVYR